MSDLDAARRQTIQTLTNEIKRLDDPQRDKELELLREKWRRQQDTIGMLQEELRRKGDMPHTMNERQMREVAETIADDLFINGAGDEADRLVLTKDVTPEEHRNLGGWSRRAVTERVVKALREYRA